MNGTLKQKLNDFGFVLRFITPLFTVLTTTVVTLALFILADLNAEVGDLSKSYNTLRDNMVFKCDYVDDKDTLALILTDINERIREVERGRRR